MYPRSHGCEKGPNGGTPRALAARIRRVQQLVDEPPPLHPHEDLLHVPQAAPADNLYGSDHGHPRCRVCMKLQHLRYHPNPEVEAIVRAYGDLDEQLAAALGPRWPHRLARAARGAYAR